MRRNTPLRVKQLCQIRLLHSLLLCHVREGCGLSLSTEASVCTVETGPGQVMCAALTHVTVTYKNTPRCFYFSALWVSGTCGGSCGWDVIMITQGATAPCVSATRLVLSTWKHDSSCTWQREHCHKGGNGIIWRLHNTRKIWGIIWEHKKKNPLSNTGIKVVSEIS